jgi:hypothetical protein
MTKQPSKEVLERVHSLKNEYGKMAAIDPDTGEWFLGETLLEAVAKGREKHPDKVFHVVRVGSPVAYQMKGLRGPWRKS